MNNESKRAALLLPSPASGDEAQGDAFRSQHLACQLYAANHDLDIVGLYGIDPADRPSSVADDQIPIVGPGGFDLVLAVAPDRNEPACAEFTERLERLRSDGVEIVFIDRARMPPGDR